MERHKITTENWCYDPVTFLQIWYLGSVDCEEISLAGVGFVELGGIKANNSGAFSSCPASHLPTPQPSQDFTSDGLKVWSWASSICITGEPVRNTNFQATPQNWWVQRRGGAQQSALNQALQVILLPSKVPEQLQEIDISGTIENGQ